MFSVDLSTREWDGHVVARSGELDLVDAADVGAALDDFSVHASVEGAAASARRSRRVVVPLRRLHRTRWPHTIVQSGTPSSGAEHGSPRQQTGEAGPSPPHSRTAEPMTVKDGPALPSAVPNMARRDPATVVLFPGCGDDG